MIISLFKRFQQLSLKRQLLWLFVIVFILPGIPFVLGSAAIVLYANWPSSAGKVSYEPVRPNISELWIVTHGKGDSANTWVKSVANKLEQNLSENSQALAVDWQEGAKDLLRCSRNASVIGEDLAEQMLAHKELKRVNFIAHSAGSFMAYQFCKTLKKHRSDVWVNITYLDPVSIYRGLWWDYGVEHFGRCADESVAYINNDDGVPGSNAPLDIVKTIDVTSSKPVDFSNGHMWPVVYFEQQLSREALP